MSCAPLSSLASCFSCFSFSSGRAWWPGGADWRGISSTGAGMGDVCTRGRKKRARWAEERKIICEYSSNCN